MFLALGGASLTLGNRRRREADARQGYVVRGAGEADTFVL
jgi:hypothetical protein